MAEFGVQRVLMGRLRRGDDILEALAGLARQHGITTGWIQLLGAVERARLAFYEQAQQVYRDFTLDEPAEILAGTGNISRLAGSDEPFVHLHLTLGDGQGRAWGGHVLEGTRVFACEYAIWVLSGPALERHPDPETGLKLWRPA
ncbi:protein of unknown function DUF296 [Thermaerobacter marianensis DSM 12885]|uniref:PPC domain-containing protein n=1 Tax=Thermaerobacter marianensis (strain ATCC 700841 / DSM 12885 / JCM 10246 / 7p75a) TaxID=644966 RepID=E6SIM4_THEM7|nr:PPC domain-containing DNA-binding protein [Thermaerobacter marianensis]ADU50930.1 protein of unknown function DUF296 [Thermaerobacter marianensis DSM 12885]